MAKKRVLVAMSGGVDSSVAAFLLKQEKKYDVIGIHFNLFPQWHKQNIKDAQSVCKKLDIPFHSFDYSKEFKKEVVDYFCGEYANGRTPNPCAVCNEKIKFAKILDKAKTFCADYVATGHYVKKAFDKETNRYILKKGKDKNKDQSYFLFSLTQEQLKRALFPLGSYTKERVRDLAKKIGLKIHDKPESQDVCFVSGRNYHEFFKNHLKNVYKSGPILNSKGETVGEHIGIPFYTIGQRKGLGPYKKPMYVIRIDKEKNVIVIGEEKELYSDSLIVE
ncbi:MAG: tRNA 2-thiouridine(34) synthase MnmA, partial [Candidatus Ratteibacteria bacterium]|nr:tRNA 2-thiouridine(34) synthase MnmA [Candidatus Ratteibacteria bacterium]